MEIDLAVKLPGFLVKRTMKGGMETATDGLRKQVLKVKRADSRDFRRPCRGPGDRLAANAAGCREADYRGSRWLYEHPVR